ncbi:hypothetical protein C2E23DRAFT_271652 [Lenzites betulinus]|nr:hypothetical protein C2E23DRAFT_271652 [Lenzites betulinus]
MYGLGRRCLGADTEQVPPRCRRQPRVYTEAPASRSRPQAALTPISQLEHTYSPDGRRAAARRRSCFNLIIAGRVTLHARHSTAALFSRNDSSAELQAFKLTRLPQRQC